MKPQPAPAVSANAEILHLAGKKVAATGQISGDGFIVMKGSGFSSSETKSCQTWIKSLRAQLNIINLRKNEKESDHRFLSLC